jgi:hypothetical protein
VNYGAEEVNMPYTDDFYTGEIRYNGRWYDLNDPEQREEYDKARKDWNEYQEEYGDWLYHYRRDERGGR